MIFLLGISIPAFASPIKSASNEFYFEDNIKKDVNCEGDVYAFAGTVDLSGSTNGDIIAAASEIDINTNNISVDYYINLLKLTTSFNNINEVFNCILSINEIKIIHSIAATYCRQEKYKIAKDILLSLIHNMNTFNISSDLHLAPEIYYNLSKLLFIEGNYTESILYANKGVLFCINNNFSKVLADLFYILGQCYENLDEIDNSLVNYNKFICLYDIFGHDKFSLTCKQNLINKYGKSILKIT